MKTLLKESCYPNIYSSALHREVARNGSCVYCLQAEDYKSQQRDGYSCQDVK